ncbi:MAG: hypothetical protein NTY17_13935 [Planctomycetia bacterium]|nr:hypothetical protein [Planctomycetia bacterium]
MAQTRGTIARHQTVFLLSAASRSITGANIMADLGMTSLLVSREPYSSKPITGA